MASCNNCGKTVDYNALQCPYCGRDLPTQPASEAFIYVLAPLLALPGAGLFAGGMIKTMLRGWTLGGIIIGAICFILVTCIAGFGYKVFDGNGDGKWRFGFAVGYILMVGALIFGEPI